MSLSANCRLGFFLTHSFLESKMSSHFSVISGKSLQFYMFLTLSQNSHNVRKQNLDLFILAILAYPLS